MTENYIDLKENVNTSDKPNIWLGLVFIFRMLKIKPKILFHLLFADVNTHSSFLNKNPNPLTRLL